MTNEPNPMPNDSNPRHPEFDLEKSIATMSLRTGLKRKTIKDLLDKNYMYIEQLNRPRRWEQQWPVMSRKNEKR